MHDEPRFNLLPTVLAWVFPGLGHWVLGYRRRAVRIAAGITFLYVAGLLVGGLDVIDRKGDFWWYCGQAIAGPVTPVINAYRERHPAPDDPAEDPGYTYFTPSFGKINEVGTLYTTLAGLLNLLAILDVIHKAPAGASASSALPGGVRRAGAT